MSKRMPVARGWVERMLSSVVHITSKLETPLTANTTEEGGSWSSSLLLRLPHASAEAVATPICAAVPPPRCRSVDFVEQYHGVLPSFSRHVGASVAAVPSQVDMASGMGMAAVVTLLETRASTMPPLSRMHSAAPSPREPKWYAITARRSLAGPLATVVKL